MTFIEKVRSIELLDGNVSDIKINSWAGAKNGMIYSCIKIEFKDGRLPQITEVFEVLLVKYTFVRLAALQFNKDFSSYDSSSDRQRINNFVKDLMKLNDSFSLTVRMQYVDRKRDLTVFK